MKCSNPDCNRGIGLIAHRRGWSKRRYCSRQCRDASVAERPNRSQQVRSATTHFKGPFSKTKVALSAAIILSTAFPVSGATTHHRVTHVGQEIYNTVPDTAGGLFADSSPTLQQHLHGAWPLCTSRWLVTRPAAPRGGCLSPSSGNLST